MSNTRWIEAIKSWRSLLEEECWHGRQVAILRDVANSMAVDGEPVDEAWIRDRLARQIRPPTTLKPPQPSRRTGNSPG